MLSARQRWSALAITIAALAGATFALVSDGSTDTSSGVRQSQSSARALAPAAETRPVPHSGDAADDPAIWIHPRARSRSTIIGTDKRGGLAVYDLAGRQLQYVPDGRMNNVDLRAGFGLGGRRVALVAASNRSDDSVALYRVDERTRRLVRAGSFGAGITVYGLCMHRSRRDGRFYVFVDSKRGEVEQWLLTATGRRISARRVRSFDVGSDVEGCVADDALSRLYVGEEQRGIWRFGAEPDAGTTKTLIDSTGASGHLTADVEGLAIADGPGDSGLLIASSQGDDTFAVYRRDGDNAFVGRFRIGAARGIDDVEETDGIDVTTTALGPRFPGGLLVAQDGRNPGGNQNFKLVRWRGFP